ncbi:MAG: nucleoside triphosphate pyrophosphohydrolase [Candidatus Aminicenantes bacterium]|nr:MAG: nucleoside triphosphate pyrophosphohydrolase [Candidatus Aminicenantes bacterium]
MKEFNKLVKIMKQLRNPINGCPWDRKQTGHSLREYILEEAHELVEAIEKDSIEKQKEELGDLLLQIVFLSQIHREKNHFTIRDVINTINQKLIRRHPHIFGDLTVESAEEVKQNWEKIKKKEKKRKSIISDYPAAMPALSHAKRVGEQASGVGFDWDDPLGALEKVEEEVEELKKEIRAGHREKAAEEIGDLLFSIANVARLAHVNPEFALKNTNKKFVTRFRYIEDQLRKQGKDINQVSMEEMEALWQESKVVSSK